MVDGRVEGQVIERDARVADLGVCPFTVPFAIMEHRWDRLTFLHWSYEPEVVQRLLPPGLTVETFDGRAWVGLVPFEMIVTVPHGPRVPWLSRFPETNVRTYVTAPDGTTGVWFLSLDASLLPAVVTARAGFALPYFWSAMELADAGPIVSYRSVRRWPRPAGANEVAVRVGERFAAHELDERDHWLTARWRLYSAPASGGLRYAHAWHEPWVLHRAEVLHLDDTLVVAGGLPAPQGDPLVHWSPGVQVRIGPLRRLPF